jgi:hypothetical protein
MSPYLVITGDLTDSDKLIVEYSAPTKQSAENFAKDLLEADPGTEAHIFSWETGFMSKPRIEIDRMYSNNYIAPVQAAAEPEVQIAPVVINTPEQEPSID